MHIFKPRTHIFPLEQLPAVVTGAFSIDFTINLTLQCRTFSRALKTEKLKAPLFPVTRGLWIQMTDAYSVKAKEGKRAALDWKLAK